MTINEKELLIGAHTSAAGGVHHALLAGKDIGATTIQLFTSNQKRWQSKPISDDEVELWHKTLKETGLKQIMSHDSYLINLAAPDSENLQKSRQAFKEEYQRCLQLKLAFLNFHPGASLKDDPQQCLDRIVDSLLLMEDLTSGEDAPRLLLETTAGQGSSLGCKFEELSYIINKVHRRIPIGVCIDTCHIFVAGYDIRTTEGWDATLNEFDQVIGLDHLYAFHINDSLKGLGSRVDRHKPLGEGEIGLECFNVLMNDKRTKDLPKYLETPDGPELWIKEIKMLRHLAKGKP